MIVTINKEKFIIDLLLVLYWVITNAKYFALVPVLAANVMLVSVGILALLHCIRKRGVVGQIPFFLFVLVYTCAGYLSFIYNGNSDIQELFWPLGFMSFGLLFLNFRVSVSTTKYIYYGFCILVAVAIIQYGGVSNLVTHGSRNIISVYTLLFFCMYALSAIQGGYEMKLLDAFIGAIVCIIAVGRSGVLIAALLLVLVFCFFYKYPQNLNRMTVRFVFESVAIVVICVLGYNFFAQFFIDVLENFEQRGIESVRILIWTDYAEKALSSPLNFLLGADIAGTYWLDEFSDNLHNSFFMLHAKYGIAGLLLVLYLLCKSVIYIYMQGKFKLFLPLLLLLVRMNFDYTNFNASLDTVFIFFILYPYYEKKKGLQGV